MFCHWRYVLDNLFGPVRSLCARGTTLIPERRDERGRPYACTADDAAYAMFELEGGVIAQFNSSWVVRVHRDDLLRVQVDGTAGSAVAGLRKCFIQPRQATPMAVWNPDIDNPHRYRDDWIEMPAFGEWQNAFRQQWELFLRHVVLDEAFRWDLREGAKGVQLAELGLRSWQDKAWVDVPELPV
jgi:predicted dehydrogenase